MKIVNWQSVLTDHQYYTWLEFTKLGNEIEFVLGKIQNVTRKKQGWTNTDISTINSVLLNQNNWWKVGKEIIRQNKDSIHIFNGFWADRRFIFLIFYAITQRVKIAIMNESYSEISSGYLSEENKILSWLKVKARPLLYKLTIKLINLLDKNETTCLFTISSLARTQFIDAGFISSNIFPFGYFIPQQPLITRKKNYITPLRIVFVGTLLRRKGVDLAIGAISEINQSKKTQECCLTLDIYGFGNPQEWISPTSSKGINYKGIIPYGQAQSIIAQYDLLLLPSRHDGWGVVVNEALLQGVPVILSDKVGAKCLIENNKAGIIFRSTDQKNLIDKLYALLENEDLMKLLNNNASKVSEKITPQSAALYLQDVLKYHFYHLGERPIEFWNI